MLSPAEPQQVIDGWKHAVPTMRRGEVATVTMQSEYAYSTSGTGSGIPPNAPLTIVIELWDWRGQCADVINGVVAEFLLKRSSCVASDV